MPRDAARALHQLAQHLAAWGLGWHSGAAA